MNKASPFFKGTEARFFANKSLDSERRHASYSLSISRLEGRSLAGPLSKGMSVCATATCDVKSWPATCIARGHFAASLLL